MKKYLVTGGAGFIGANFVLAELAKEEVGIVNLDKLTYAGTLLSLEPAMGNPNHRFVEGDICDGALVRRLLDEEQPAALIHFAAESHVDRSIDGPAPFIQTNVVGTFTLLEAVRGYLADGPEHRGRDFRFIHVSTDEVFGSLGAEGLFHENTPYAPNSPYSASKAASDHLVRAYRHTYGIPAIVTNCSNNYGPLQFPEKLIPLMILNALEGKPLPVYGDGGHVRDWLHVLDHCKAIARVVEKGIPGETYTIGGDNEETNLDVVKTLCEIMDRRFPDAPHAPHEQLIAFVEDRPGHDRRYAIDATKIRRDLGWAPEESFQTGLEKTVAWYLEHRGWCRRVTGGMDRRTRLGLGQ